MDWYCSPGFDKHASGCANVLSSNIEVMEFILVVAVTMVGCVNGICYVLFLELWNHSCVRGACSPFARGVPNVRVSFYQKKKKKKKTLRSPIAASVFFLSWE